MENLADDLLDNVVPSKKAKDILHYRVNGADSEEEYDSESNIVD